MKGNSYLQIDLSALERNIRQIRREIGPQIRLIPVLKGHAYGLGAVRLAEFLDGLGGIDTFAVSHVAEGIELRQAGFGQEILVLSLPLDFQLEEAVSNGLTLTLGSFRQFPLFRDASLAAGRRIPVSLKLDTGLHRIGFVPGEEDRLCAALRDAEGYLNISGTFSHFSSEQPEQLRLQIAVFRQYTEKLREAGINPGICHMFSSASLEAEHDTLFDAVRIGRRLFLDHPCSPSGMIEEPVSFRAYLTDIRDRKAGDTLAYGGRVVLDRDTRVGVLSVGYGDGLDPALAAAHAPVLVGGQRASLIAMCMDQSFVDLGDISCSPEDEVTLFGHDGKGGLLSAQEVAACIGWEGCDLTARLTARVERIYTAAG